MIDTQIDRRAPLTDSRFARDWPASVRALGIVVGMSLVVAALALVMLALVSAS